MRIPLARFYSRTLAEVRSRELLRLVKRDYIVQDGDILNIRFNI